MPGVWESNTLFNTIGDGHAIMRFLNKKSVVGSSDHRIAHGAMPLEVGGALRFRWEADDRKHDPVSKLEI
jgi:hypothetical protein